MTSKFETELLELATEDWYGLPEALGVAQKHFPASNEAEQIETARASLRSMIDSDLIFLCLFKHKGNKEVPIECEKAKALLDDTSEWYASGTEWHLRFAATENGEEVYRSRTLPA